MEQHTHKKQKKSTAAWHKNIIIAKEILALAEGNLGLVWLLFISLSEKMMEKHTNKKQKKLAAAWHKNIVIAKENSDLAEKVWGLLEGDFGLVWPLFISLSEKIMKKHDNKKQKKSTAAWRKSITTAKEISGLLGLLEGVWGLLEKIFDLIWPLLILLSEIICMAV